MKKALMLLSISLLAGWFSLVQAQGTTGLKVTQMIGYPVLPDTAYEGVSYSVTIKLQNFSNSTINGGVNIVLKTDSGTVAITTFAGLVLFPNDSATQLIQTYNFDSQTYKAGNNIVVVWPVVQSAPAFPIDTFFTQVYFVPLASLNAPEVEAIKFALYPNPATSKLKIVGAAEEPLEYVRILMPDGRQVTQILPFGDGIIDIRRLNPGIYFLEASSKNRSGMKRFIKVN
ncbi:MAG: T9SS type A sorting domain-containing protein [Bacteroidetes bacterium]|nr:T9SS type A sorting domain-containing protein [Bacteroidota bacterium]MBK9045134.1 T9SS type A sorting domain-containing protein [Bacteroidota bacterium]MBK9424368.1 T9SS type A sorting domain-containing protein [Bacteroidota bacterium]MBL0071608.1 T9SS type A sorting domain-containing protein [Bacteroidota bacterium]